MIISLPTCVYESRWSLICTHSLTAEIMKSLMRYSSRAAHKDELVSCHKVSYLCRAEVGCMRPFLAQCWLSEELHATQGECTGSILPLSLSPSRSPPPLSFSVSQWCNKGSGRAMQFIQCTDQDLCWECVQARVRKCANPNIITSRAAVLQNLFRSFYTILL